MNELIRSIFTDLNFIAIIVVGILVLVVLSFIRLFIKEMITKSNKKKADKKISQATIEDLPVANNNNKIVVEPKIEQNVEIQISNEKVLALKADEIRKRQSESIKSLGIKKIEKKSAD